MIHQVLLALVDFYGHVFLLLAWLYDNLHLRSGDLKFSAIFGCPFPCGGQHGLGYLSEL
jgi:hypothetical protein